MRLRPYLLLRGGVEDPEDGEFSGDGFTGSSGCSEEDVDVLMVECVEDLRLDGVEVGESVECLVARIVQRRDGQRLQGEEV